MKYRFCAAMAALLVTTAVIVSGAAASQSKAEKKVQTVKLTYDKGYVMTPGTVTKGVPVKMEVDLTTVKGCMRTVVIAAFDVKKTVKEGDTTIEFTPTKSGKIEIVCGMNMGRGSFVVTEPATH